MYRFDRNDVVNIVFRLTIFFCDRQLFAGKNHVIMYKSVTIFQRRTHVEGVISDFMCCIWWTLDCLKCVGHFGYLTGATVASLKGTVLLHM